MKSLDMIKSGDYAKVLAYLTEYVVDIEFFHVSGVSVLPGIPTLSLMVGEEVEVLEKHNEDIWTGRIMGSLEKGAFPCHCVRKKWPFPGKNHGENDRRFSSFANLPQHVRENIYENYFNLSPRATIRLPTELEEKLMRQNLVQHITYQDSAGNFRASRMLNCAALFASNRFIAQEASRWLTRTVTVRANTYKPLLNVAHIFNDGEDWRKYSPNSIRTSLPLARYTEHVEKLEIDAKHLVGIPELLARYCNEVNVKSLKLSFASLSRSTANTGYYKQYKDVVFELWHLGQVCAKHVDFIWLEMDNTFKSYSAADREQYCAGFLLPIESLKESMQNSWVEKYEPLRLLGIFQD